jgi:hypothetical protein
MANSSHLTPPADGGTVDTFDAMIIGAGLCGL